MIPLPIERRSITQYQKRIISRPPPNNEGLDVGDPVRVELIGTDVERGFIDFAQAGRRQGD